MKTLPPATMLMRLSSDEPSLQKQHRKADTHTGKAVCTLERRVLVKLRIVKAKAVET